VPLPSTSTDPVPSADKVLRLQDYLDRARRI
jgi:hypothetical protein